MNLNTVYVSMRIMSNCIHEKVINHLVSCILIPVNMTHVRHSLVKHKVTQLGDYGLVSLSSFC